ncbi:hypothetical protein EYC84_011920 [Monilinia fructicola]|uniref:Uncharacterized protein n=1 Tax=Monilinia fructicola TaxID=38448 RepID=A0A5M9J4S0_MONFR|nr:hypothetical protein EYC84_011920 [Monilinia fructicola]
MRISAGDEALPRSSSLTCVGARRVYQVLIVEGFIRGEIAPSGNSMATGRELRGCDALLLGRGWICIVRIRGVDSRSCYLYAAVAS